MLENTGCSSQPQEDQLPVVTYMSYKCCSHGLGDVSPILVAIVGPVLAKKRQSRAEVLNCPSAGERKQLLPRAFEDRNERNSGRA